MSFSSAGEFRTVLQQYKYGPHQIFCVIKILPDKVCFYEKEPENDFNWMTAARWAKLESSLWRIFASLANWKQDARLLKTELVVDHINVSIKATEKFLSAARTLLMNEALSQNDLELEIVLRYMSHEDSTIVSALPIKRKHSVEVKPTQMLNGSDKANKNPIDSSSAISTKPDKTKQVKLRDNINEPSNRKRPASATTSRKRERRSISHDSHHHKHLPQPNNSEPSSRGSRTPKPSKSPLPRPDSAELRPERRSARSPKKPSHYAEYIIGQIKTQKSKSKTSENNVESSSDKKSSKRQDSVRNKAGSSSVANGNTAVVPNTWKYEQLDGARINVEALKKINDMLDVPKPREVEILLLDDMDEAAVLNTFETYREDFDRLFKERQHKFQTLSFMSIDHCHIMDILNKTIRDNMIKKLGEVYSKSGPHGSLVINGLLPLWIIRLFMDKYKFTQDEAVRQIADQLKYNTYLKAVNNDPLSSDLED